MIKTPSPDHPFPLSLGEKLLHPRTWDLKQKSRRRVAEEEGSERYGWKHSGETIKNRADLRCKSVPALSGSSRLEKRRRREKKKQCARACIMQPAAGATSRR